MRAGPGLHHREAAVEDVGDRHRPQQRDGGHVAGPRPAVSRRRRAPAGGSIGGDRRGRRGGPGRLVDRRAGHRPAAHPPGLGGADRPPRHHRPRWTRTAADRGGRRGRLRTQHLRRPLRRRLRRLVPGRHRRRRHASSAVAGAGRRPGPGARAGGRQRAPGRAAGRGRASTCGRSTPRPPWSSGCGPSRAGRRVHAVVGDMADLDPAGPARGPASRSCCAPSTRCSTSPTPRPSAAAWPGWPTCWRPGRLVVEAFVPPPGGELDARDRRRAPPHRPRRGGADRQPDRPGRPHRHRAARADHGRRASACARGCCTTPVPRSSTSWPPRRGCAWSSATLGGGRAVHVRPPMST